jgi:phage FluMu gp28-like protein
MIAAADMPTTPAAPAIVQSEGDRRAKVREHYWLPTQEAWINDKSRKKLLEKCRRFGGSYAEAFATVMSTSRDSNKFDAWVSSRDMLAARMFTEDCKTFARKLQAGMEDLGEQLVSDPEKDLRAFSVEFSNGKRLHSLSSHPDAIAGKQGRFTKDEAALHKDLRAWFSIAQPAIMRGGSMSFISTHRGSTNFFNALIQEIRHKGNPKKFSLHSVNIEQAVREGLWIKIEENLPEDDERRGWSDDEFLQSLRDECADEEAWKQEYMCEPCDDAAALLSWEDIIACTETAEQKASRIILTDAEKGVGMDVARKKHFSVITTVARYLGKIVVEEMLVMQNEKFAKQELALFAAIRRPGVKAARTDATGLGMQLAENAETAFPGKAQGRMLSAPEKLRLALQLLRKFQDRSILIQDDPKLHYDLFSVKKLVTAGDQILLRSEAGSTDGHADRFWSLALAVDAIETQGVPLEMILI